MNKKNVILNDFSESDKCLFYILDKYFTKECNDENKQLMTTIINKKETKISLRILDWFITKYSKNTQYITINSKVFNIRTSYKSQLKSFKKKSFDPFKRNTTFEFKIKYNNTVETITTTLGQLNFFKWLITNNILSYIKINLQDIINNMKKNNISVNSECEKYCKSEHKIAPKINNTNRHNSDNVFVIKL